MTIDIDNFRAKLLAWYNKHRRDLPWRAQKGEKADPYRVWLSEIMLQQTTVQAVAPYFLKFIQAWPSVKDLAACPQEELMEAWAGLGYYARARNLHKCAQIVANDLGGKFPDTQEGLRSLPGIGDYTSAAITAIAFDKPASVMDANVERIVSRIFALEDPLPRAKPVFKDNTDILCEGREDRPGDFAQSMMDLGSTICTPKSPKCMICPIQQYCQAFDLGIAEDLPKKEKKKNKPQKHGYFYWVTNERGEILIERRAENGMLGGMLGLPSTQWVEKKSEITHSFEEKNGKLLKNHKIRHSFTHFDLDLSAYCIDEFDDTIGENYIWMSWDDVQKAGFPTLFKKAIKIMQTRKV